MDDRDFCSQWVYPPPPHPLKGLLGAGFAKMACKI
jgi:hypothetical protein